MAGSVKDRIMEVWQRLQHPFHILESSLPELDRPPSERDRSTLLHHYHVLTERGNTAIKARLVVVALLSLSVVSGAVGGYLRAYELAEVSRALNWLVGISTALSAVLLAVAFVLNRYIANLENRVLVLGMQISATHRDEDPPRQLETPVA